jgi:hypothetical protein
MDSLCSSDQAEEEEGGEEKVEEEKKKGTTVAKLTVKADEKEDEKQRQPSAAMRAPRLSLTPPQTATQKNQARRDALVGDEEAKFKWCTRCRRDLSVSCYRKDRTGIFGLDTQCRACRRSAWLKRKEAAGEIETETESEEERGMTLAGKEKESKKKEANRLNTARSETELHPIAKFCSICLEDKELNKFSPHPTCYFGRQSKCKDCKNRQRRSLSEANQKKNVEEDAADDGEVDEEQMEASEAETEPETEAESGPEAERGADVTLVQVMTAVEKSKEAHRRNQERRIVFADPSCKWCGVCLEDRPVIYFAGARGGGTMFARARNCNRCSAEPQTAAR